MQSHKEIRRGKIRWRIRKVVKGTAACPRLAVFRSNKQIYAQLIDDINGQTLAAASSRESGVEGRSRSRGQALTKVQAPRKSVNGSRDAWASIASHRPAVRCP